VLAASNIETAIPLKKWVKTLPHSKIERPDMWVDVLKYVFWRIYTPYHPFVRDTLLALKIVRHEGRQDFLVGKLSSEKTLEEVVSFLIENGYGNHFIAWRDEGEVVGLRLVEDFEHQYHIRIFKDGEVRAHFEYTPESRPILHIKGIGMEDRSAQFRALLRGWVV